MIKINISLYYKQVANAKGDGVNKLKIEFNQDTIINEYNKVASLSLKEIKDALNKTIKDRIGLRYILTIDRNGDQSHLDRFGSRIQTITVTRSEVGESINESILIGDLEDYCLFPFVFEGKTCHGVANLITSNNKEYEIKGRDVKLFFAFNSNDNNKFNLYYMENELKNPPIYACTYEMDEDYYYGIDTIEIPYALIMEDMKELFGQYLSQFVRDKK